MHGRTLWAQHAAMLGGVVRRIGWGPANASRAQTGLLPSACTNHTCRQREVTRSEAGAPAASSRRLLSSAKQQAKGVALPISQSKSGPSSSTPMQALLSRPAQASRMQWPLGGVLGGQGAQVHSWHGLVGHVVPCADRR